jgi:hypothetical protein
MPIPIGVTQLPYPSAPESREAIYSTLKKYILAFMSVGRVYRSEISWETVDPGLSPVAILVQSPASNPQQKQSLPPLYKDKATLRIGIANSNQDPDDDYEARTLNTLRDQLDTMVAPDQPDSFICTLAGRAVRCWVAKDSFAYAFSMGVWKVFSTTIEIEYLAPNNS